MSSSTTSGMRGVVAVEITMPTIIIVIMITEFDIAIAYDALLSASNDKVVCSVF